MEGNDNHHDVLGWWEILDEDNAWSIVYDSPSFEDCYNCEGRGYLHGYTGWECPVCNGTGLTKS